ncbi:MAG: ATP-binding cassette domain-containing protein [Oscillospiraceae bacterium]|nr:ATP-binding cassette domain-containing protein [Oscillospiraceae bacterium]
MSLLEVKDLKKYFKTPKGMLHAVDGVHFTMEAGETLGIVGESGCGKSTLGRVILHLLDSTGGQILFDGEDITRPPAARLKELRKDMQMVFQDPYSSIDPRMRVRDIIGEPLKIYRICPSKEDYDRQVSELMDRVGLASRVADAYPHELDGGRRQRIGIARALSLKPRFIVCDEPVSALDVSIQAQILNLLQDLQDEMQLTYIFITHNLSVVKHISDHISVMYLGNMVERSSATELFKHQYHPYTKALLSAIPVPSLHVKKERTILKGELTSPIDPPNACRFAPRCLYATERCSQEMPCIKELTPGHFVACHHACEINGLEKEDE